MFSLTCTAPVNIAVIKYWGKRDEDKILPINSSLSVTLDQGQLRAKTSVAVSKSFKEDCLWLNGQNQSVKNPRIQNIFQEIRRRARKRKFESGADSQMWSWHVHVCSENNFPTAAGLASSAAGYACLVYTMAKLFNIDGDISEIARQGSGSACRSVYGGFVEWEMGQTDSGHDSVARQLVTENHWPDLRVLILVVSSQKKHTSSSQGMQTSVNTSQLLQHRANNIVPNRLNEMKEAIKDKNFEVFAELTMKDSNEMHACCLDTYPPISYMRDTSRDIQRLVHHINEKHGKNMVTYTFDAGPNACLFLPEENVSMVLSLIKHCYPASGNGEQFVRGLGDSDLSQPKNMNELVQDLPIDPHSQALQYIIHTKVGPGPQVYTEVDDSLLDDQGLPKHSTKQKNINV